ncbi:iron ABC transporter permease [Alkalicella caledoniensis]|uniref:Iron ABC transporter permease n=2 Tax=Alkalicella caledoniensis TaxID=2731377 RepID=A0A7G9WD58_ALKCA|nr:iron ABC transporter permease [Alkalicella caledoniensis]
MYITSKTNTENISKGLDIQTNYTKHIQKKIAMLCLLTVLLFAVGLVGLSLGGSSYTVRESWEALRGGLSFSNSDVVNTRHNIIWKLRVPRVMMAIIGGAGLAFSGVVMQTILKNPLASPFTLGISSAASFGAALAIIMRTGFLGIFDITLPYDYLITGNAFTFSLICTMIIYGLTKLQKVSSETIILLGVAMMNLFSAATSFLQYLGDPDELASLTYWMFGSLSKVTWSKLHITCLLVIPIILLIYRRAWDLNSLMLGEESAKSTGINVERLRLTCFILTSLVTAVVVSFLGPIGFIGLVAPHLGRILFGGDHRFLIPASSLLGALLLLLADTIARTLLAPVVIPVGIITSFVGVPLLIYLMMRRRTEHW